jgi:hypothetical protein
MSDSDHPMHGIPAMATTRGTTKLRHSRRGGQQDTLVEVEVEVQAWVQTGLLISTGLTGAGSCNFTKMAIRELVREELHSLLIHVTKCCVVRTWGAPSLSYRALRMRNGSAHRCAHAMRNPAWSMWRQVDLANTAGRHSGPEKSAVVKLDQRTFGISAPLAISRLSHSHDILAITALAACTPCACTIDVG